jgi:Uma2 family endonuclease
MIELLSSSDRLTKGQAKIGDWIENGAKLGWLIDPYAKNVHVYERDAPARVVPGASARGTGPVEGFVLDLTKIWRRYQL